MSAQHTPGPWFISREGRDGQELIVRSMVEVPDEFDGGMYKPAVADLYRGGNGNEHDARLIAAAPELLEALKAAEEKLRDHQMKIEWEFGTCRSEDEMESTHAWGPEVYAARAAITKATGGAA